MNASATTGRLDCCGDAINQLNCTTRSLANDLHSLDRGPAQWRIVMQHRFQFIRIGEDS